MNTVMNIFRPRASTSRQFLRPVVLTRTNYNAYLSTRNKPPPGLGKVALLSASVGVLIGAGYGGYTHYKVNVKSFPRMEPADYAFFPELPDYTPTMKVVNENDTSNLNLVLFQYRTCPFCCKVRTFLDYHGISYDVVEVDAVLRQDIKWSGYKKVPILLAKAENGYQQLLDSTMIISALQSLLSDSTSEVTDIVKCYPVSYFEEENGKVSSEVMNKYFIMHKESLPELQKKAEEEERKWRQWADSHLVHLLSPNVYRSMDEAFQAFNWFAEVGQWWQHFPAWECYLMINGGAVAMYLISKRLKKRHNIEGDERLPLYKAANDWMNTLKEKGTPYLGGDEPNLADLSVFGVFSSIEGCDAFVDLRNNTDITKWYDSLKQLIDSRKGKAVDVW